MALDPAAFDYNSLLDDVLLDAKRPSDPRAGELYTEFLPADKMFETYLEGLADSIPIGQPEPQTTGFRAAEVAHMSPPQTPPAGSVPVNTSSAPSHPTSSDDAFDKCGDSGKRKRFRNKNDKNVALNKLSQLRYREKKKAKSAAMQQSAEALSKDAAEIQALRVENMVLQDKNLWLQTSLEQVERRLDAARLTAAGGSHADQVGAAVHLQARGANGAATPPSEEQFVDGLKAVFEAKYAMLAEFLAQHGFAPPANHDPAAEASMPVAALDECRAIVAGVMAACRRLTIAEGTDADKLLTTDFQQWFDLAGNWDDPDKFIAAVRALQLSRQQISKLLQLRELWTEDVRRLCAERQSLNLELIGVMLPAAIAVPGTTEQLPSTLQPQDDDEQQVVLLMDRLESNLRTEMRRWSQYDYEVLVRVLTPVQGAMYISRTYPEHCDPFALVNAVHEIEQGN